MQFLVLCNSLTGTQFAYWKYVKTILPVGKLYIDNHKVYFDHQGTNWHCSIAIPTFYTKSFFSINGVPAWGNYEEQVSLSGSLLKVNFDKGTDNKIGNFCQLMQKCHTLTNHSSIAIIIQLK